jgi:phage tail P2-like protein
MSLLPGNLPTLEHHFDDAENRLSTIDIQTRAMWNAWQCPEPVLPFLAWAVSVDVWESSWPVELQRQVVSSSLEIHRYKGTPKGVKLALASLGLDFEYSEWWQASPRGQPGTFAITVYVNNNLADDVELLGAKNQALIKRLIDCNKRGSAHYEFNLGLGIDGQLFVDGGVEPVKADIDQVVDPPPIAPGEFDLSLVVSGDKNTRVDVDAVIDPTATAKDVPGQLFIAGQAHCHQTLEITIG